jgi:single-strand DNA-binding protein
MPRDVNSIHLRGRLCADPELKYTPSGSAVCNLRVATNTRSRKVGDKWEDIPEFHNIQVWGSMAELAAKRGSKGAVIEVSGELRTRKYTGRDGNERFITEVVAGACQVTPKKNRGQSGGRQAKPPPRQDYGPPPMDDDDIPF